MKLISWNVNGLRACMTKGFAETFAALDADVFCLQETKLQDERDVQRERQTAHQAAQEQGAGESIRSSLFQFRQVLPRMSKTF